MSESAQIISLAMPKIGEMLEETLGQATGRRVGFFLMILVDGTAQSVCNFPREDYVEILQDHIDNFVPGRPPAGPAH